MTHTCFSNTGGFVHEKYVPHTFIFSVVDQKFLQYYVKNSVVCCLERVECSGL